MTHDKDEQAKVWNLAEKIGFCMLATQVGDSIRSRPMSAHPQASENAFYFLTDVASQKDYEIETNRSVCLAFAEPRLGGIAQTIRRSVSSRSPLISPILGQSGHDR